MDCTDVVIGFAYGDLSYVADYYTRDRSTPRRDEFYGGVDSLTGAVGWEVDGTTTIIFRKKLEATEPSDHSLENAATHVIWARGQEDGAYTHCPNSGIEHNTARDNFYGQNELKYHGYGTGQRGSISVNFFEYLRPPATRWPSDCTQSDCEQYSAQWEMVAANKVMITVMAQQSREKWIAIGFSETPTMENVDVIYGYVDGNGMGYAHDAWIGSRYTTPVNDDVGNVQTEIKYLDGTYSLIITRDVRTGDSQDLDLDKDLYMMFPVGGGNVNEASMTISRHTMTPSLSGAPVNLYESLTGSMNPTTPPALTQPEDTAITQPADVATTQAEDTVMPATRWPSDCTQNDCELYSAQWEMVAADKVRITVRAKQAREKWLAIGFSETPTMENVDVIYSYVDGSGTGHAHDAWIGSRYSTPVIDKVENVQAEITYFDGTYNLVITRDVRTGDSQDLDLDKDLYMMFPVGGGPISVARASATIGRHTMTPSVSDAPVNLYESLMGTMRTTPPAPTQPEDTEPMQTEDTAPTQPGDTVMPPAARWPSDCTQNDCELYSAQWEMVAADKVRITVTAKQAREKWVAIGFSETPTMENVDVIYGYVDGLGRSTGYVHDAWIGTRYTAPVIDNVENIQAEIEYSDGTYSLIFTRDVRTGDSQDLDLDKDLYMMFPIGGGAINEASMTIGYHTMTPSLSDAPVNLYQSLMGTMRTTTTTTTAITTPGEDEAITTPGEDEAITTSGEDEVLGDNQYMLIGLMCVAVVLVVALISGLAWEARHRAGTSTKKSTDGEITSQVRLFAKYPNWHHMNL